MTLDEELQVERDKENYNAETNHFAESINSREFKEHPEAGQTAPVFSLPDENGNSVSLQELLNRGPVILTFLKGNFCQYCDLEMKAIQRSLPEFDKYGATVLAITPHTVSVSYEMREEKQLSYTCLSDAGNEIAYTYGLRFKMQQSTMDVFASFGLQDMVPLNGDQGENTNTLPIPGTFVVGKSGNVIFAFVDSDHTKRAESSEIVAALMSETTS